jgi:hypothetical protein
MPIPNVPTATSRAGKPVNVADQVSVVATVVSISGTGGAASVTILTDSGTTVVVPAKDLYNAQTL